VGDIVAWLGAEPHERVQGNRDSDDRQYDIAASAVANWIGSFSHGRGDDRERCSFPMFRSLNIVVPTRRSMSFSQRERHLVAAALLDPDEHAADQDADD